MIAYVIPIIAIVYIFSKRADLFFARSAKKAYLSGDIKKCLLNFEKAEKAGNLNVGNRLYYGTVLLKTGRLEKARVVLAEASMLPAKPELKNKIRAMRALVVWKEGDIKEAISSLEELASDFKNTAVYQDLGLLYILDKSPKALSFNLEAYEYNSDDLVIKDNLAEAYALSGDSENAEKIYKELLKQKPHFPEPYYGYGILLFEKGEKQKGLDYIKQALDKKYSYLSVLQKDEVEKLLEEYRKK